MFTCIFSSFLQKLYIYFFSFPLICKFFNQALQSFQIVYNNRFQIHQKKNSEIKILMFFYFLSRKNRICRIEILIETF